MDRDKRWERTKLAYDALTLGVAPYKTSDAVTAVSEAYERGETDEFIKPTIVTDSEGNPEAVIQDTDSIVFLNFRPDRARQLTWAFVKDDFEALQGRNARKSIMSAWHSMMKPWICP